ncbi:uncharacterized protein LOC130712666 [Lotus japonicus]|uniref:uncharacterized protein LOC130712666 n=1 Tax=Lotus japonicus TaxID=34305 RepID=UPI002590B41D|nr:uncharacterized protein LOC130712666 [Lotus japonicus]
MSRDADADALLPLPTETPIRFSPLALAQGSKFHASVKRERVYKFDSAIVEGSVYSISKFNVTDSTGPFRPARHAHKLTFELDTKVIPVPANWVTHTMFNSFTSLEEIFSPGFDANYLVDFMGVLIGYGTEKTFERYGQINKQNHIEIESNGKTIKCTLFGSYVDSLNAFLSSGNGDNAVVVLHMAKVNVFNGKINLQNAYNTTKLLFNPDFPEAVEYKQRFIDNSENVSKSLTQLSDPEKISEEDEFLKGGPRKTISEVKQWKMRSTCIVIATISDVDESGSWYYIACKCNKSVSEDSDQYFCANCNRHVVKASVTSRFCIRVSVDDDSESATFVIFDRDAASLLKTTCQALIDIHKKPNEPIPTPPEVKGLLGMKLLFKVECSDAVNFRYEPTYRVKKICSNPDIIAKFVSSIATAKAVECSGSSVSHEKIGSELDQCPCSADLLKTKVVSSQIPLSDSEGIDNSATLLLTQESAAKKGTDSISKPTSGLNVADVANDKLGSLSKDLSQSFEESDATKVVDSTASAQSELCSKKNPFTPTKRLVDEIGTLQPPERTTNKLKKVIKQEKD